MKERATVIFPYAIAAALPLAGLVLALARAVEGKTHDAAVLLGAALLGTLIWFLVLS